MWKVSRSARERLLVVDAELADRRRNPRADAEAGAALRQRVERADLHGDQARMPGIRIPHADADADAPRRDRAGGSGGQHAALERVLRKPDRGEMIGFRRLGQLDAAMRIEAAMQPQAEFWQGAHFTPSYHGIRCGRECVGARSFPRPRAGAWTRRCGLDKIVSRQGGHQSPAAIHAGCHADRTDAPDRARADGLAACRPRRSRAYPDRPVKLVVALAPGGPADTAARVFAPYFAQQLGQNVVIENRTGRLQRRRHRVGGARAARRLHAAVRVELAASRSIPR